MSPTPKNAGALFSSEATPTISVASAIPIDTTLESGLVASIMIFSGAIISGKVVSTTETL